MDGYYNSGNRNSGDFCTDTPQPMFFDQQCDITWEEADELVPCVDVPVGCQWVAQSEMTDEEKSANPNYAKLGGYLKVLEKDFKEAFSQAWTTLDEETKQRFLNLPNFDAEKFLAITGVDVRAKATIPAEVIVDGRRYVLAGTESVSVEVLTFGSSHVPRNRKGGMS